jgi:hypothetical protein
MVHVPRLVVNLRIPTSKYRYSHLVPVLRICFLQNTVPYHRVPGSGYGKLGLRTNIA